MLFSFSSTKLKRQLESEKEMAKAFGHVFKPLKLRLGVLDKAPSLGDVPHLPPDRRHELFGNWAGHFAVVLTGNYRLIFKPDHDPVPTTEDGGFDLAAITAIQIVAIIDYHEK